VGVSVAAAAAALFRLCLRATAAAVAPEGVECAVVESEAEEDDLAEPADRSRMAAILLARATLT
jgi:hypothetical protein